MPPVSMRIFLCAGPTDLRKGFEGLAIAVRAELGRDVLSGEIFLFANRRRDRVRAIYSDGSGLWVATKRLEHGTFAWPLQGGVGRSVELRAEDLALLLGGLDLGAAVRRPWWRSRRASA